jgi:hypothetical protein
MWWLIKGGRPRTSQEGKTREVGGNVEKCGEHVRYCLCRGGPVGGDVCCGMEQLVSVWSMQPLCRDSECSRGF